MVEDWLKKEYLGKPIPEWDRMHQLSIHHPMGPEVRDNGTIFSINSRFMDVVEPSFLNKQMLIMGVFLAFLFMLSGPYIYWLSHIRYPYASGFLMNCLSIFAIILFGSVVWKVGRGLFFGLRRRPIRFHREASKLYFLRARRFFQKSGQGDIVWEVPWTEESVFCLHRVGGKNGMYYIRYYEVDGKNNVTRMFVIGSGFNGWDSATLALGQWDYWRKFMNEGPGDLPQPVVYHTQHETIEESFLFSMYALGMGSPAIYRILMMPFICIFTISRILANATCRDPIWPESIEKISEIASDDPYVQPCGDTPVGWGATVDAIRRGDYPLQPSKPEKNWKGEKDRDIYAAAWLNGGDK